MSNSNLKIVGRFALKIYHADGRLLDDYVGENLVVNQGKDGLAKMLGGDIDVSSGEKVVDTVGFGSSAAPATVTDTVLTGSFEKAITEVTYPAANQINFFWELGLLENNGATIREFGLITGDGGLFARKVRGTDIVKTDVIRLEGNWTVTFI